MNDSPIDQLRTALTTTPPPANGVVGLLDNVLKVCQDNDLQLTWQNEQLRVRNANGTEEVIEAPLRKSVFRAALARIAVLCNEESAGSVSPYGGTGSFSVGGDHTRCYFSMPMCEIAFLAGMGLTPSPLKQRPMRLFGTK